MSNITFSNSEKLEIVKKLQDYFEQELEHDLGQFDAEFLLDFFSEQLGAYYYNQGLQDAQAILQSKIDTIVEGIDEIIRPTAFSR